MSRRNGRPVRHAARRLALSLVAVVLLAPAAAHAQESLSCEPSPNEGGPALTPGECRTYSYTIRNTSTIDGTFFTRVLTDATLVVVDQNDNPVSTAQRDAFLNAYFTVTWDRHPWLSVPDPMDLGRNPSARSGGVDAAVEPVQRSYCGPHSPADGRQCRLGRIHRAGSTALTLQPTDERLIYLNISFSPDAIGTPYENWILFKWTVGVTGQVPAASDCPSPDVSGVCTTPVYER